MRLYSFQLDKQVMHIERYDKHIYRKRKKTNVQIKNKKVVGTHDANKKKSNTHKCYYFYSYQHDYVSFPNHLVTFY